MVAKATRINKSIKLDLESESAPKSKKELPKQEVIKQEPPKQENLNITFLKTLNIVSVHELTKETFETLFVDNKKCFIVITNEDIKKEEPEFKFEIRQDPVPNELSLKEQIAARMDALLKKT